MSGPEITVEEALNELREYFPHGRLEVKADMTETGKIHVVILSPYLPIVPYGSTLDDAMQRFRSWKEGLKK